MSNFAMLDERRKVLEYVGGAGTARKPHPGKPLARAHTIINGFDVGCANAYS